MNGNVMWMSDSFNCPSGFGQQTFHAVSRLTSGPNAIHIDNIGWQWSGNPASLNENWRVLPAGGRFASEIFPYHVRIYKPDVVVTLADLWNVQYITNTRRVHDFKWLQWMPIDGQSLAGRKWSSSYNNIDALVAMSDFGYNELASGRKLWTEGLERDEPSTRLEKIYHGVPTDIFRPYNEEEKLSLRRNYPWVDEFHHSTPIRDEFIKGEKKLEDYFIFGIVARNQHRKNYPELLQAWAKFAEENENVLLWIHASPADPAGMNLYYVTDQLGCSDSVIFSDSVSKWYGKSSAEMADIFNLFDCHFLPTAGEGFGIPTVEAMACGLPVAISKFTTGNELVDEGRCGYLMEGGFLQIDRGHVQRLKYSPGEIQGHLQIMRDVSDSQRADMGKQARKRAVKLYDAADMAENWRELIDKYMNENPTKRTIVHDLQLHYNPQYMAVRERDANSEYAVNEYRIIGKYLKENDNVLEVGCGSGEGMVFLSRHFGVRVAGIDLAESAVKMCRRKGLYVNEGDFESGLADFADNAYDVVYSQHVVEHLDNRVGAIIDSLRVARRASIHCVPHDNMRDLTHKVRYTEEVIEEFIEEVVDQYDGHLLCSVHKNYVFAENKPSTLVSYAIVFEKQ